MGGTVPRRLPTLLEPSIELEEEPRGAIRLRSRTPLAQARESTVDWLERWGAERPNDIALIEADSAKQVTWGELLSRVRSVARALRERQLSLERPILILSENSIAHAVVALAAAMSATPYFTTSVAYSLLSQRHRQLLDVAQLATPGLVFVEDASRYARALEVIDPLGAEVVAVQPRLGATPLDDLLRAADSSPRESVSIGSETVVKVLMTSGSTGRPRGVLNTQRMLTSNQQMMAQVWPFVDERPQTLVDWLPWSHTFGGNHNFNLVLRTGGTLVISAGRPTAEHFGATAFALRHHSPTFHLDVPAGWGLLAKALEDDDALRRRFFSELEGMFYAAAPLPQTTWDRLERLAQRQLGVRPWLTTGWGTTETSPMSTAAHFASEHADRIGIPAPGVELRLMPVGERFELRVRGPHVTPGYHRNDDETRQAFDEEGFFRTGDAATFVERATPEQGLRFAGRLAEDFKLSSGTWVRAGRLRADILAAADGLLAFAVAAGARDNDVTFFAWLDEEEARAVALDGGERAQLNRDASVQARLLERLRAHNAGAGGASRRIARIVLLDDEPRLDAGELTDKGYPIAQVIRRRRAPALEGEGGVVLELVPGV